MNLNKWEMSLNETKRAHYKYVYIQNYPIYVFQMGLNELKWVSLNELKRG